jgi:hypothetical protein
MKRILVTIGAVLLAGVVSAGCQATTGKTLSENVDDSKITAEVKAKLVADRAKNLLAVNVDTNQGVVYLIGNVETADQKAEAERIARSVSGVQRVVNNLQVRTASTSGSTSTTAAASPATAGDYTGRHTMTGRVTQVDATRGHVHLQTAEAGEMVLHFPPSALQNVKTGDRITVEMALKPER